MLRVGLGLWLSKGGVIGVGILWVKYWWVVRVWFDRLEWVLLFKECIKVGK